MPEETVKLKGVVRETYARGNCLVVTAEGHQPVCALSKKLKKEKVALQRGQRVVIEVSPARLDRGVIVAVAK